MYLLTNAYYKDLDTKLYQQGFIVISAREEVIHGEPVRDKRLNIKNVIKDGASILLLCLSTVCPVSPRSVLWTPTRKLFLIFLPLFFLTLKTFQIVVCVRRKWGNVLKATQVPNTIIWHSMQKSMKSFFTTYCVLCWNPQVKFDRLVYQLNQCRHLLFLQSCWLLMRFGVEDASYADAVARKVEERLPMKNNVKAMDRNVHIWQLVQDNMLFFFCVEKYKE